MPAGHVRAGNFRSRIAFAPDANESVAGQRRSLDQITKIAFADHLDSQLLGLGEFASGIFARNQIVGFFRHTGGRSSSLGSNEIVDFISSKLSQFPGHDARLSLEPISNCRIVFDVHIDANFT